MYWGLPHMTSTIERGGSIQKADKRRGGFVILYMKRVEGINSIRKFCGNHLGGKEGRNPLQYFLSFLRPRFCQNNCFSRPLYLSTSPSIFFGTRSISFFLCCVRLTDKVPPALILKKSLSLSLSLSSPYISLEAHSLVYSAICREGACSLAHLASLSLSAAFVFLLFHLPLSLSFCSRSLFYLP